MDKPMEQTGVSALLMNKECPYDYKCKDVDCMECIKVYTEGKA